MSLLLSHAGGPAGAEVVQLYVRPPAAASPESPPQALAAFTKVALSPGGAETVAFNLTAEAVRVWDVAAGGWALLPGEYGVAVGGGSRDIRLLGSVSVV